jgi:hypothetical protein
MALDMETIEKLQMGLHGKALARDHAEADPDDLLAVPEDVWGMTFTTWIGAFEKFFREESNGGTCMENWSRSRFFEGFSATYRDLKGDNPGAIVRLPVYSKVGTRLISDNDRMFDEDEHPIQTELNGQGSGLWIPLKGALTLDTITKRTESRVSRAKRDAKMMKDRGNREDRLYYERYVKRLERWL